MKGTRLTGANMRWADFTEAKLQNASMNGCNLIKADFHHANLTGALLENSDLTDARNLTVEQLLTVRGLKNAVIDDAFMKRIREERPDLVE